MAITINWGTRVISIPKTDLTQISTTLYELDVDVFRLRLKDLEDDEDGMPFLRTHNHNPTVTVGGSTLARVVEIINGYTVTFEDGQYAVRLVGANNNIADVLNLNQVSLRSSNSAGLVQVASNAPSEFVDALRAAPFDGVSYENVITDLLSSASGKMVKVSDRRFEYRARDGTTVRFTLESDGTTRTRT